MGQRWNDQEVESVLAEQRLSGLSQRAYCEKNGIKYGTFQFWKHKRFGKPKETTSFVKATLSVPQSHSPLCYTLKAGDYELTIPVGFDPEEINKLVLAISC